MRILFVLPGIDGGGVGQIVYNYISHINKEKFICDVLSLDTASGSTPFLLSKMKEVANSVSLFSRHHKVKRFLRYIKILSASHYDIVHVHFDENSFWYLVLAKSFGVKVLIAHSHINKGIEKSLHKKIIVSFLKRIVTAKFACGLDAGRFLWGNASDVYVMANAIEMKDFVRPMEDTYKLQLKHKIGIAGNKLIVGTVGRISEQKNPYFIVNIVEEISKIRKDVIFIWIGEGDMYEEIQNEISKRKLSEHFILLGRRNDVCMLLKIMDAFILPSLYEGLPIVGVESQAAGVPSFFSCNITREVGISAWAEYLDLNSPAKWAHEILKNAGSGIRVYDVEHSVYNIDVAVKFLEDKYEQLYVKGSR